MATQSSLRSPRTALAVAVLAVAGATALTRVLPALAAGDGVAGNLFGDGSSALAIVVQATLSAAVPLVGTYAALTLDRFERPLLVVAPTAFVVVFVANAGFLAADVVSFGLGGTPVATRVLLASALADALSQTAFVVAVVVVVRAVVGSAGATATTATTAD